MIRLPRSFASLPGAAALGALAVVAVLAACGERRDTAAVAADLAPFTELRGINIAALRSGGVRAFRRDAEPSPFEGLREPIGAYDVLFAVPGFTGADGSWPREDALVSGIEATRDWPSDSSAEAAWHTAVHDIRAATGATPSCLELAGPGFALSVVEFPRGGTWVLAATFAAETSLANRTRLSARHSIGVHRASLTSRYPEAGAPNPDDLPTWTRSDCPTV